MEYSKELVEISCKMVASSLGYTSLKDEQLKVFSSFIAGNDVFAALPTGKSLCYACLPGVFDLLLSISNSVVAVITSLTAIMKNQVSKRMTRGSIKSSPHSPNTAFWSTCLIIVYVLYKLWRNATFLWHNEYMLSRPDPPFHARVGLRQTSNRYQLYYTYLQWMHYFTL